MHLALHLTQNGDDSRVVLERLRRIVRHSIFCANRAEGQQRYPQEEVKNVAHSATQHGKALKEHGQCRGNGYGAEPEDQQRGKQRKEIDVRVGAMEQVEDECGEGQNQDHGRENRKVAERLTERVKALADRRRGQNLAHAGLTVALNGVLDNIEADQTEPHRGDKADDRANPGGVIGTAVLVQLQGDLPGVNGIPKVDGEAQGDQEAVAPHALQEIRADHLIEGAGANHVGAPARCLERQ